MIPLLCAVLLMGSDTVASGIDLALTDHPPAIDGMLDGEAWSRAVRLDGFVDQAGSPVQPSTSVWVCADSSNLYIALECHEPRIDNLVSRNSKDDTDLYTDDSIAVFITPNFYKQTPYYHFILNTAGARFDQVYNGPGGGDRGWNADWRGAVRVGEDRWTAEMAIPLEAVGLPASKDITLFGLTIARNRIVDGTQYSVWPAGGWYHAPKGHVRVKGYRAFVNQSIRPMWEQITGELGELSVTLDPDDPAIAQLNAMMDDAERKMQAINDDSDGPQRLDALCETLRSNLDELVLLKRSIHFASSMAKLHQLIAQQPSSPQAE